MTLNLAYKLIASKLAMQKHEVKIGISLQCAWDKIH